MKKKNGDTKSVISRSVSVMQSDFSHGDFWSARKAAKKILASESESAEAKHSASRVLYVTRPDSLAVLAGVGTLIFSVTIGFLAAY